MGMKGMTFEQSFKKGTIIRHLVVNPGGPGVDGQDPAFIPTKLDKDFVFKSTFF